MNFYLRQFIDWVEVWALLIPLAVLAIHKKQPAFMRPVVWYVVLAFFIFLAIDCMWKLNEFKVVQPMVNNNWLYNVHVLVHFTLFSAFFIRLEQPFLENVKRELPVLFLAFAVFIFRFKQDFFKVQSPSSLLMTVAASILLFYCLQYYLYRILDDDVNPKRRPDYWVVTGLIIYLAITYIIFMIYAQLVKENVQLAENIWYIINGAFLILCCFLAKAFYESKQL